jgi:hypothetical protein
MGNTRKEKKQKYTKEQFQAEAMQGLSIGFELVEEWKRKFKLVWIIRVILIGLVLWGIYWLLKMNGVI